MCNFDAQREGQFVGFPKTLFHKNLESLHKFLWTKKGFFGMFFAVSVCALSFGWIDDIVSLQGG